MEPVWSLFRRVSGRRQVGMAANPILPSELREFCDQLLIPLSAWTADLIYRLDDAVLAAWAGDAPKPKPSSGSDPIPVENVKDIRALFLDLKARKAAQLAATSKRS